ncbi:Fic family protein [Pseudobutyrivibrio sp. UC1225]|uniref:Fic family protein n=1 Tax=Pseudobutyrivibrio sp. UC1225 TaxID=1798185 RepID=UPI0008E8FEDC|nr:Fic family protein [Pseudobutyrivibrio sp. UC1225]SFO03160.1 Fic family protein [Pseudobutyrivibrio sp. UC1225]
MREFNYSKYKDYKWDSEILGLVSGIHEYRGKQELYLTQKPAVLDKLVEVAKVQSTESSNAIEGIFTSNARLNQLMQSKTTPKNRDEEEIAGYRYVLDMIHESYEYIPISANYILQLHQNLYRFTNRSIGGHFKNSDNHIVARDKNGVEYVIFEPLSSLETPIAIDRICEEFNRLSATEEVDTLLLIPIFIHDFLCVHPFNDGNGRMSRLLTTLLLYRAGYVVGRYVSLEKKIAELKDLYYDSLNMSQKGWHEGEDDPTPFIKYILKTIIAAYKDFEERIEIIDIKEPAIEQVRAAVYKKIGKFTKSEIMEMCPKLGRASVENSLTALVNEEVLERRGSGRGTYYVRKDALV